MWEGWCFTQGSPRSLWRATDTHWHWDAYQCSCRAVNNGTNSVRSSFDQLHPQGRGNSESQMGQHSWASPPIAHSKRDRLGAAPSPGYQAPIWDRTVWDTRIPRQGCGRASDPPALALLWARLMASGWAEIEPSGTRCMGGVSAEAGQDH